MTNDVITTSRLIQCLAVGLMTCGLVSTSMTSVQAQQSLDTTSLEPIPELQAVELTERVRLAIEQSQARLQAVRDAGGSRVDLANAYADLGEVYLAHELMVQAKAAFNHALRLMPDRSDWHYLMGIIERAEGRIDAAIAAFDRALEQAFPDVLLPALIRRGRAYLEKADWERARSDFERALELNPESAAAIGGLGRVALRSGQADRAAELLLQALALDPSATRLHQMLGLAYRELGRLDEARAQLALAGDGEEWFDDPVLASVQAQSRSPQFYLESGLAQAEAGNFYAAAAALSVALQLDPDNVNILSNYGNVLARIERLELAAGAYRRMTELEPENAEGWLGLGQLEELQGNLDAAMDHYRRSLQADPDYDSARAAMAYVLLEQGRAEDALILFQQLTERAASVEHQSRWWYWQGIAQMAGGECAAAGQALERSRELNTTVLPPALGTALARLRATCWPASQNDLNEALVWAEQIYQAEPGLYSAETLAMTFAALGRFEDALDLQAQAIFEALKNGRLESKPHLQTNMSRYQQRLPAAAPFAENDPIFIGDPAG